MAQTAADVRAYLAARVEAQGLSAYARELGLSRQQLQQFLAAEGGEVPPKIARAIGVERETRYTFRETF
jgi:DNA-binding phage protein